MKKLWIVVADEAIARFLERSDAGGGLDAVQELTDPDAHASGADLQRDATGRRSGSATHSARPNTPHRIRSSANVTASAGEEEQHLEAEEFAKRVSQRLADDLRQGRFEELRLVAAPRFLGLLRKALTPQVAACVTDELDKDFIHLGNEEIARRLLASQSAANAR